MMLAKEPTHRREALHPLVLGTRVASTGQILAAPWLFANALMCCPISAGASVLAHHLGGHKFAGWPQHFLVARSLLGCANCCVRF